MALNIVEKIDDAVQVKHVLLSVSDKTGLDVFVPRLLAACPDVKLYSTGGTYTGQESALWRQWLKEKGVEMVFIDPFHNYTAAAMEDSACEIQLPVAGMTQLAWAKVIPRNSTCPTGRPAAGSPRSSRRLARRGATTAVFAGSSPGSGR